MLEEANPGLMGGCFLWEETGELCSFAAAACSVLGDSKVTVSSDTLPVVDEAWIEAQ